MTVNRSSLSKRIPLLRKCIVRVRHTEIAAPLCNISIAGAYIGMEPIPHVGDVMSLEILLPGNRLPIVDDAQIIWRNAVRKSLIHSLPVGGGARFVGLGVSERRRLEHTIRSYIPPIR